MCTLKICIVLGHNVGYVFGNGPHRHKPFQMCKKNEHKLCYDKSASGDTWFAHSIEELVIWTVERHYGLF